MAEPMSIFGGILTAEGVRRIANHLDESDDELKQALNEGNLERAIRMANDDRGDLERIYDGIRDQLRSEGRYEEQQDLVEQRITHINKEIAQ